MSRPNNAFFIFDSLMSLLYYMCLKRKGVKIDDILENFEETEMAKEEAKLWSNRNFDKVSYLRLKDKKERIDTQMDNEDKDFEGFDAGMRLVENVNKFTFWRDLERRREASSSSLDVDSGSLL